MLGRMCCCGGGGGGGIATAGCCMEFMSLWTSSRLKYFGPGGPCAIFVSLLANTYVCCVAMLLGSRLELGIFRLYFLAWLMRGC